MSARCLAGLAILLAAASTASGASTEAASPDVVFEWSCEKRAGIGDWVPVEFAGPITLADDDQVRFSLRPLNARTFVYLFYSEENGPLEMLFPREFTAFSDRSYAGTEHFMPSASEGFTLTGSELNRGFILLASSQRLKELEAQVTALRRARPAEVAAARQRLLDEIIVLRRKHSTLIVVAETPVPVAGSFRTPGEMRKGGSDALSLTDEAIWTHIEAVGFYIRTFRVEH